MHWSGRIGLDTNTSLWAGFHVEEILPSSTDAEDEKKVIDLDENPRLKMTKKERKGFSFFHAGDTGYSAPLFEGIGQVLGPVTLAAIVRLHLFLVKS